MGRADIRDKRDAWDNWQMRDARHQKRNSAAIYPMSQDHRALDGVISYAGLPLMSEANAKL